MKNDKKPTAAPATHRGHEAFVHNAAPRLEGVVKNKGTKPHKKEKKERLLMATRFPEWLLQAQAALAGM